MKGISVGTSAVFEEEGKVPILLESGICLNSLTEMTREEIQDVLKIGHDAMIRHLKDKYRVEIVEQWAAGEV